MGRGGVFRGLFRVGHRSAPEVYRCCNARDPSARTGRAFFSADGYRQCNHISNADPAIAGSIQLWKPMSPISRSSQTIMGLPYVVALICVA